MSFHRRLKALREKRGKSMTEIAVIVGIPASTYREWEYGRAIRGEPYLQIARALNVSVVELLTGERTRVAVALSRLDLLEAELTSSIQSLRHDLISLE